MIVKTDAVVLKSMRYRDTSKIVTFYTRAFGRVAGIAKGARVSKSKFGASLEPMTEVGLVLYKKEQRDLQLISQCDILKPFKQVHSDMEKMSGAMAVVELLHQLTHSEEENPALYNLLVETLEAVEKAPRNIRNIVYGFQLRFASLYGFNPVFDRCVLCGTMLGGSGVRPVVHFRIDRGGMWCGNCPEPLSTVAARGGRFGLLTSFAEIRVPTAQILHRFLTARLETLSSVEYHESVGNEVDETLRSYLQYHFEELRPLKSPPVFRQISL
ncbi:MAG: DNA repair protein RecO [Bacteroidota bacterium]